MTRLIWDQINAREFQAGIDRVVVYPSIGSPTVWNGILSISDTPEDAETEVYYYDGQSYIKQKTVENFTATVEAVTYPEVLDRDEPFHLAYRVQAGNGYDIHLVYNALLSPTEVQRTTVDDTADTADFQWKLTAVPEQIDHIRAAAHVIINTEDTVSAAMTIVMNLLYGTDGSAPRIPLPTELVEVYETYAVFTVVDNGDGSWTATGPDDWFNFPDADSFEITSPSAEIIDSDSYRLGSW